MGMRLANIAAYLAKLDRFDESRDFLLQSIKANESLDIAWVRAVQQSQLTHFALRENNTTEAELHVVLCLEAYWECGNIQGLLGTFELAGFIALRLGNEERAGKLIAGAERHFLNAGVGRPEKDAQMRDEALQAIRNALGEAEALAIYTAGALMSLDELYNYARAGGAG
jgi:hypothetical protein